jgi:epoxyqueuosine reductase QueG
MIGWLSVGYLKDDQFTKHLPRYCRDLKQILDDKAEALAMRIAYESGNHTVWTNERCLADLKVIEITQKTNDHIAISDAKWNKELHKFLRLTN